MSIRKKPEQAVTLLLARLDKVREQALSNKVHQSNLSSKFDDFTKVLKSMRNVFPDMKRWEKTITDQFCALEQELDNDIFKHPEMESEVEEKLVVMTNGIRDLMESIPKVDNDVDVGISRLRAISFKSRDDDHQKAFCPAPEWVDLGVENRILESEAMLSFFGSFHCLSGSPQAKMCSLCLSVFPLNSIIQKKPLIYWWIGEGLVMKSPSKTAEEVGEQVFRELVDEGFISPSSENKSMSVSSFVIDPWIHRMLILIATENKLFDFSSEWTLRNGKRRAFLCQGNDASHTMRISGEKEAEDLMMVFNVKEKYLGMKPEWLSKLKKVEVLQMGRWQNSVTHHIEVEDQSLFNTLGSQKHLKYLSLRGISRIETLPASISKLISLQILDLRACHNLEKLPPTISRLKNLTHLDVSHCYLLESMPKGLEQLLALQVIKGFVIGKADKNSCRISDLAGLLKLRKLSIRVEDTQQDDQLGSLDPFPALRILTISWGNVSSAKPTKLDLSHVRLTKLDLRCVPFESAPDWLSLSKLPSDLTKLYIEGGRLKSLDTQFWKVKYLRFKYLPEVNKVERENYKRLDKFDCYELCPDITSTTGTAA
ncbi:hypothetical protein ACS0TY_026128 [Phlomoides rotata]